MLGDIFKYRIHSGLTVFVVADRCLTWILTHVGESTDDNLCIDNGSLGTKLKLPPFHQLHTSVVH